MRQVFKYRLEKVYRQRISLPGGAEILKVDLQFGEIVMWAHVDPTQAQVSRIFYTIPTGEGVEGKYLATLAFNDGAFILHVFEGTV